MGLPPVNNFLNTNYLTEHISAPQIALVPDLQLNDSHNSFDFASVQNEFALSEHDILQEVFNRTINHPETAIQEESPDFFDEKDFSHQSKKAKIKFDENLSSQQLQEQEITLPDDDGMITYHPQLQSLEDILDKSLFEGEFSLEENKAELYSEEGFSNQVLLNSNTSEKSNSRSIKEYQDTGIAPSAFRNSSIDKDYSNTFSEQVKITRTRLSKVFENANTDALSDDCKTYVSHYLYQTKIKNIYVSKRHLAEIYYSQKRYFSREQRKLDQALDLLSKLIDPTTTKKQKRNLKDYYLGLAGPNNSIFKTKS